MWCQFLHELHKTDPFVCLLEVMAVVHVSHAYLCVGPGFGFMYPASISNNANRILYVESA